MILSPRSLCSLTLQDRKHVPQSPGLPHPAGQEVHSPEPCHPTLQDGQCVPQSPVSPTCRSGSALPRAQCHPTLQVRKYTRQSTGQEVCIPEPSINSTLIKYSEFTITLHFPIHTENMPNWNLNYPAVVLVRITQRQLNVIFSLTETMTGILWSWGQTEVVISNINLLCKV